MGKREKQTQLCKIVYFDEDSVTDYIQIVAGGKLEKTTQLLNQTTDGGNNKAGIKAGVGVGGVLKALMGFEVSAATEASLDTSFNTERMAKNILKNTILTDFIDILMEEDTSQNGHGAIQKFVGYAISAPKDSLSYVAVISPYLSMLKGGSGIPAGEFNIAVEKLDNTIKAAKGYYEFVGSCGERKVIFRFNIKSFKNNYKVIDLLKMDINIYAIKVGTSTLGKLNFNSEFDIPATAKSNPTYRRNSLQHEPLDPDDTRVLDVYDVLLAGVETEATVDD